MAERAPAAPITGLTVHDNALGFTCIRLHYTADPDKDSSHPEARHSERARAWFRDAYRSYPDPNDWEREMEINFFVGKGTRVFPFFHEATHTKARIEHDRHKVIYRAWDFGWHCFPLDHQILTASGWRNIGDVERGDRVMTLNTATHAIEEQPVRSTVAYRYTGPMYEWPAVVVTAGHSMVYETRTGRILTRRAVDLPRCRVETPVGRVQDGKPIGDAQTVLLALYLSAGSTRHDGTHYYTWIWQSQRDPWMEDWLRRTGYPWRYDTDRRGGRGWCVAGKSLHEMLRGFGHARDKYVPDEVKRAPAHEIELFLYAYTRGDGTRIPVRGTRRARSVIYTGSRRMADDMQELFARIGVAASIRTGGRSGWSRNPVWRVAPRSSAPAFDPRQCVITTRTLDVACVTVDNGTLLVRRSVVGTPVWTGNCPTCLVVQTDRKERLLILHEIVGHQETTREFAERVIAQCTTWFATHAAGYEDLCDPAGQYVKSIASELNERRDVEVLQGLGIFPRSEYGWSRKDGRTLIHQLLALRHDGTPGMYVSAAGCTLLLQAFLGQYVYPERKDARIAEDPNDDEHPWGDLMAALRYLVTGLHGKLGLRRLLPMTPVPTPGQAPGYHGYGTRARRTETHGG